MGALVKGRPGEPGARQQGRGDKSFPSNVRSSAKLGASLGALRYGSRAFQMAPEPLVWLHSTFLGGSECENHLPLWSILEKECFLRSCLHGFSRDFFKL